MFQSKTDFQPGFDQTEDSESLFFIFEEDDIFEQNIDDFDEEMDNHYDDGIAHSVLEDQYDEDLTDETSDEFPEAGYEGAAPEDWDSLNDELEDYDELED